MNNGTARQSFATGREINRESEKVKARNIATGWVEIWAAVRRNNLPCFRAPKSAAIAQHLLAVMCSTFSLSALQLNLSRDAHVSIIL
jgi:hypothetical protein